VDISCELINEPSGSIKCRMAAQLVASRAVLSSTELVMSSSNVMAQLYLQASGLFSLLSVSPTGMMDVF
jgi:hypothetical protein